MCKVEQKKKLAIMGASKWQLPIYLKAREMGIETYGFAYKEGAFAKDSADFFYPISLIDKEIILEKCREIGVSGVVSCASDFATEISCWIAEKLGLNTNTYNTIRHIHNKAWVREKTQSLKTICHPLFCYGKLDLVSPPFYPCIVKPVHGNGKRGVWFVQSPEDFESIKLNSGFYNDEDALIEQVIDGKEYSAECLSFHSRHYVVQVTEKISDGAPHFVELAHHQPAIISTQIKNKIIDAVDAILTSVGFSNGASHIEFKISNEEEIFLIDLNPRGGGDYISTHLVSLSTNCDYSKEIINIALNRYSETNYPYKNIAFSGVYFLTKQTDYLLPFFKKDIPCIIQKEYIEDVSISISNNDRSGYMIYQNTKKLYL